MYAFALQMWHKLQLFFTTAFQLLGAAGSRSYQSLCDEAHSLSRAIDQYYIPEPCSMKFLSTSQDHAAVKSVPDDLIDDLIPLTSTPNGNCLSNAANTLLFGNERMSTELRLISEIALMQLDSIIVENDNTTLSRVFQEQIVYIILLLQQTTD